MDARNYIPHDELLGRMRSVLRWVALGLGGLAIAYLSQGRWLVGGLLGGALLLLSRSFLLVQRGRYDAATDWMLGLLTLACALLALTGQGLRDTALLAFPGLLVFAGMLRPRQVLFSLLAAQIALVLAMALLYHHGLLRIALVEPKLINAADVIVVLGLTGFAVWLLAMDLHRALDRAGQESERAITTLQALEGNARKDQLTGLPNRLAAKEGLGGRLQFLPQDARLEAALLNLDGFSTLNEAFGSHVGDELLSTLATRLRALLPEEQGLYRLGGDEFLAVRQPGPGDEDAEAWARRMGRALQEPIAIGGIELRCSASTGLADAGGGERYEDLVRHADLAMRAARQQGRGGIQRFEPTMRVDQAHHLSLLAAMRRSLYGSGFALHYQPKIDLQQNKVVAAEALLRWEAPGFGAVGPAQFIPLAEQSGLIVELGNWVLREACAQAAAWRRAGWSDFKVAVNVSAVQLRQEDFADIVLGTLQASGLPGKALVIELTESVFAEGKGEEAEHLRRIGAEGVSLSIDDFGTGYSNLGYLSRLAVQQLKIDQRFVRELDRSPADRSIVETIIGLAKRLQIQTVAEGIEETRWAEQLRAMGCDLGQGYLWSKPLPAAHFFERFGVAQPELQTLENKAS
jgi:diguanylate cyclase (GGDEF)-like protein